MRGGSELSPAAREFIYAYCSALNGCHFARTSHRTCAIELGIAPEAFDGAVEDLESASLDERLRAMLRYARKLTLTPAAIEPADAQPLYDAGWSEQAVVDMVVVVALVGFINRVLDGLSAWSPDDRHEENGRNLAAGGYLPVADAVRRSVEAHLAGLQA
jgi:uncharacterized peroxidase-related enzyme